MFKLPTAVCDEPPEIRDAMLQKLLARRSVSPRRLTAPGPSPHEIECILQIGMRGPDYGRLHSWRVIEVMPDERSELAQLFEDEKLRRNPSATDLDRERARDHALNSPVLLVFVVAPTAPSPVPQTEQWLAAGAALGNVLNAAHVMGYGACILSGVRCSDEVLQSVLGLRSKEHLTGLISIGQAANTPLNTKLVPIEGIWRQWSAPPHLKPAHSICGADP